MGKKERPYYGHTASINDHGTQVASWAVTTIQDPRHALNKTKLYDASRYDLEKPVVKKLYATIDMSGPPREITVRVNGDLPKDHPIYDKIRQGVPTGCGRGEKTYDGRAQPMLEVLSGNTTVWLTEMINEQRIANGLAPWPLRLNIKTASDAQAAEIFEASNRDAQATGYMQNVLQYRFHAQRGLGFEDIAAQMSLPIEQIKDFEVFDRAHPAVLDAFIAGRVTMRRIKVEIVKLPQAEQEAALERPAAFRVARTVGLVTQGEGKRILGAISRFPEKMSRSQVEALVRYIVADRAALKDFPVLRNAIEAPEGDDE